MVVVDCDTDIGVVVVVVVAIPGVNDDKGNDISIPVLSDTFNTGSSCIALVTNDMVVLYKRNLPNENQHYLLPLYID